MNKRPQIEKHLERRGNLKSVAASALTQRSGRLKKSPEGRDVPAASSMDSHAGSSLADERNSRTNVALSEGGIDYQVEPGQDFDAKAFTKAALKRWQKVTARLAE